MGSAVSKVHSFSGGLTLAQILAGCAIRRAPYGKAVVPYEPSVSYSGFSLAGFTVAKFMRWPMPFNATTGVRLAAHYATLDGAVGAVVPISVRPRAKVD